MMMFAAGTLVASGIWVIVLGIVYTRMERARMREAFSKYETPSAKRTRRLRAVETESLVDESSERE